MCCCPHQIDSVSSVLTFGASFLHRSNGVSQDLSHVFPAFVFFRPASPLFSAGFIYANKLNFICWFFDLTTAPFVEIKRKIDVGECPYQSSISPEDAPESLVG